jgi:hypothetical protein
VLLDRHGSVFERITSLASSPRLTTMFVCSRRNTVKPFLKGHKNDYRMPRRSAEAVQRPAMHFVAIKTPEQRDLSRLRRSADGATNQIRGFLIERGIIVRQGVVPLRKALPDILSSNTGALSPQSDRRAGPGLASILRAHCSGVG